MSLKKAAHFSSGDSGAKKKSDSIKIITQKRIECQTVRTEKSYAALSFVLHSRGMKFFPSSFLTLL